MSETGPHEHRREGKRAHEKENMLCMSPGRPQEARVPTPPPVCMHCGEDHNTILHRQRIADARQATQRPPEGPKMGDPGTAENAAIKTLGLIPLMPTPPLAAQTPAGGLSGTEDTI